MQKEIWKDTEFAGYMISSLGRVAHNGKILSSTQRTHKYNSIMIKRNPDKRVYIHRLVAKAFLPNPENKRDVNHKNGNTKDNRLENLEWTTHRENTIHGRDILGLFRNKDKAKKVLCVELNKTFDSMCEACRFLGNYKQKGGGIGFAIKNNRKAMGFHWKYV